MVCLLGYEKRLPHVRHGALLLYSWTWDEKCLPIWLCVRPCETSSYFLGDVSSTSANERLRTRELVLLMGRCFSSLSNSHIDVKRGQMFRTGPAAGCCYCWPKYPCSTTMSTLTDKIQSPIIMRRRLFCDLLEWYALYVATWYGSFSFRIQLTRLKKGEKPYAPFLLQNDVIFDEIELPFWQLVSKIVWKWMQSMQRRLCFEKTLTEKFLHCCYIGCVASCIAGGFGDHLPPCLCV